LSNENKISLSEKGLLNLNIVAPTLKTCF